MAVSDTTLNSPSCRQERGSRGLLVILLRKTLGKPALGSRDLLRKPLPPVPFAFGKPALGYSLFELILVIVIIGLIAAAGLKYYIDLREEALRTGMETQARNFAGIIQGARADWLLKQHPANVPTEPGSKLAVDLDGTRIFVNEKGWPANSSAELDSSSDSQTAAECYELWFGMMNNPLPATVQGLTSIGGSKGQQRYHISVNNAICRYELVSKQEVSYYFDYNTRTGKVLINIPSID